MPDVTVTWQAGPDVDGRPPKGALTFQRAGSNLTDRVHLVNGQLATVLQSGQAYTVTELIEGRPAQSYTVQVPSSGSPLNLSSYHVEPGSPVLQTITRDEFDALAEQVANIDSGSSSYRRFDFPTAAATWSLEHDLGRLPLVTVVDTAGRVMLGDIEYPSNSLVTVTFAAPTSGKALIA